MKKGMQRTALGSLTGTCLLALLYWRLGWGILYPLAITAGTIAYHFCMRLVVGYVVDKIMQNRGDPNRAWYRLRPFEAALYKKLGLKGWKDKLPTYDPSLFSLQEHSLDEILGAMCQAEVVHETILVFSFVPLVFSIWFGSFWVFLFTSLGAAGVDLTFVMLQRYNRERILKLQHKRQALGQV